MPLVVVQIIVGIVLGPSVFGRIAPDYFQMFASPAMLSSPLWTCHLLACCIFGLISGLHLDPGVFSGNERAFWPRGGSEHRRSDDARLSGWSLDFVAPSRRALAGVSSVEFIAAVGICVSMNALPGARSDSWARWACSAVVSAIWRSESPASTISYCGYCLACFSRPRPEHSGERSRVAANLPAGVGAGVSVRDGADRAADPEQHGHGPDATMSAINTRALLWSGAATIASALATELMGLHYIIGAFVVGAIIPAKLHEPILDRLAGHDGRAADALLLHADGHANPDRPEFAGLLEMFVVTTAVAAVGIVGGTAAAARLTGEPWSVAVRSRVLCCNPRV